MIMADLFDLKGNKGLNFIHGNLRSLAGKFDQFKNYLLDSNVTFYWNF